MCIRDSAEVEPEYIEKEKAILLAQIQNEPTESQKPEKVIQGMIQGRINKELKEICLLDQVYVCLLYTSFPEGSPVCQGE